jgi:galactokinase
VPKLPETVTWSAPGRANLIGEHTDYNDGLVLPFAIAQRATVTATRRDDDIIEVTSAGFPGTVTVPFGDIGPGTVPGWPGYPLGVAWALTLLTKRASPPGLTLSISSDVPPGAGLSSSAALEIAVASALNDLWQLHLSAADLARAGRRAENEVVGAPTGIMDQYAALLGQPDSAVFLDCRTEKATTIPLRLRSRRQEPPGHHGPGHGSPGQSDWGRGGRGQGGSGQVRAGLELVLIDTGERHSHAAGGYAARRASCERAARLLGIPALRDAGPDDLPRAGLLLDEETFRRARHVVTENARVTATVRALEKCDHDAVGRLLTQSHASMRDDFEISTPALDLAVEVALAEGALGARMTGGGFGGAALALIPGARLPALTDAVGTAFRDAALAAPVIRTVIPSAGPRKER